jgi:hypothetical protein
MEIRAGTGGRCAGGWDKDSVGGFPFNICGEHLLFFLAIFFDLAGYLSHFRVLIAKPTAMSRISFIITSCFLFLISSIHAQNVTGKIKSTGDAQLHVIRLFADSFPEVSLTFQAETDSGNAVWDLQQKDVRVEENDQRGRITSFRLLSADQHLQTMVVIDHSGSMNKDWRWWQWWNNINWDSIPLTDTITHYYVPQYAVTYTPVTTTVRSNADGETYVSGPSVPYVMRDTFYLAKHRPEWLDYKSPLWYAQQGAKVFIQMMNSPKDSTGLIGFSDFPDVYIRLARYNAATTDEIDGMRGGGATAFYDAVDQSLNHLVYHRGLRAIVALTDGKDNSSRMSLINLIAKAKKMRCPVYVIGLGDVDSVALTQLTSETSGELFLTNDATKLEEVFMKISKKLQAVYEVVYESPFLKSSEPTHELQLRFDVDSMYLNSQIIELPLPESVIVHLQKREAKQNAFSEKFPIVADSLPANENIPVVLSAPENEQPDERGFPYGALAVTFMAAGVGALVYRKTKRNAKQQTVKIVNVFPNPSSGPVTINYLADAEIAGLRLTVINDNGKEVYSQLLQSDAQSVEIDLSMEASGIYLVQLQSLSAVSGTERIVIQR